MNDNTISGMDGLRVAEHIVDTHHRGMRELSRYLAGMRAWMRGNLDWSPPTVGCRRLNGP